MIFTKIILVTLVFLAKSDIIVPLRECVVDPEGEYKYIQIMMISLQDKYFNKIIVRGSKIYNTHADIYMDFMNNIEKNDNTLFRSFIWKPIGGGYINASRYQILVGGSSGSYGKCNHVLTSDIIRPCFPDDVQIKYDPSYN